MHIKIGDTVRFISEKLEGKVTGIIDPNTVNVYCKEYGFEIPGSINDLVVIRSDFPVSASEKQSGPAAVKNINIASEDCLFLGIVPDNVQNLQESRYEIYLINDTPETCLYSVGYSDGENHVSLSAGNCAPDSSLLLATYKLKELDKIKAFHIQALFYRKGHYSPRPVVDTQLKLSITSLCKSGSYKSVKWFDSLAFLKSLNKEMPPAGSQTDKIQSEAEKEKKREIPVSRPQKQIVNRIVEIDLHAEELLETTAGMENKDILDYQLDIFRKTLDEYKLRRGQKIVFIHGKGDGVLRQRILWELQTKYKRFHHQDASFKQYGYGATMVTIK